MTGPSILICDDEPELADELAEFFASEGWRTHARTNGREAEDLLRSGLAPTCMLTDLRMSDVSGDLLIAGTRALPRALQPRIIAVMTGHLVDAVTAADLGADALYVKPIDPETVVADLSRLIADSAPPPSQDEDPS